MRVQDIVRQCVVFLCNENKDIIGTGFFVAMPSKTKPENSFLHIITIKHVVKDLDGSLFLIRANNKHGSFEYLKGEKTKWFYHPVDDSVDVAVAPFWLTPDIDYRAIPLDIFVSDDTFAQEKIGVGD